MLREKVDALIRMIYGKKSEKIDSNQLTLLLEGLESKKDEAPTSEESTEAGAELLKPGTARSRPQKPRLPDDLPVYEGVLDPEEVKADPGQYRRIGEEVSEQLDWRPAQFLKRRLIRRRYARIDNACAPPVIAPLPGRFAGALPGHARSDRSGSGQQVCGSPAAVPAVTNLFPPPWNRYPPADPVPLG